MATKEATITAGGDVVVKVGESNVTVAAKTEVPAEIKALGLAAVEQLNKKLSAALKAHTAARNEQKSAGAEEAENVFPPLLWNLATYGPIQLTPGAAAPPSDVNTVIQNGEFAAMIAISYADPTTVPPSNMYMAANEFRGRFSVLNLTTATAGPSAPTITNLTPNVFDDVSGGLVFDGSPALISPVGAFSVSPFHYFLWIFQANVTPGSEGDLYECNFDVDISFPGIPGGGFSNWVFNGDSSIGIPENASALPGVPAVPATIPVWRYGSGSRFMVNNFPG